MRIAVLMHRRVVEERQYIAWSLADTWRAAGHDVAIVRGPDRSALRQAELVLLHIDRTRLPKAYRRAVQDHPAVLNGSVQDISKRTISGNAVHEGDAWAGPVILKSNRNAGGMAEVELSPLRSSLSHRRRRWFGARWADAWPRRHYRVYANKSDVPRGAFQNRNLFVERFLPERDGELYCLNYYTFLGDREIATRYKSEHPIVKRRNAVVEEEIEVPEGIRAIRQRLGFDFGKLDFVVHAGEVVLLDANHTPCVGIDQSKRVRQGRFLAPGLDALLATRSDTGGFRSERSSP